jgi:Uma2 family endonuclease
MTLSGDMPVLNVETSFSHQHRNLDDARTPGHDTTLFDFIPDLIQYHAQPPCQPSTLVVELSVGTYTEREDRIELSQRSKMSTATPFDTTSASTEQWKNLLEDLLPPQGSWSEEEYLVLTDHRNRLVEYTDGFLEALPMPTDKHQSVLQFLFLAFLHYVGARGGKIHFAPLRLRVRPGKFREPDLVLLLSANDPRRQDRYWLGADLVVEIVSEDKPERDLVDKRGDYAEGRVPEYWIVNPQTETITVLRLSGGAYEEAGTYRRPDTAASVLLAGFSVAVKDVFDAV